MKSSSSSSEGAKGASIWQRWPALVYLASLLTMLVVWHAIARFFPPTLLPGPLPVFERVGGIMVSGQFVVHMAATMLRVAAGFLSAFFVRLVLWLLLWAHR